MTAERLALVIYNPVAGRRRPLFGAVMEQLRSRGFVLRLRETRQAGDARVIAAQVLAELKGVTPDCVIAAGGDGTINEVVNGLYGQDIPLAVIPLGTANVLCHELGIRPDPAAIAEIIAARRLGAIYPGRAGRRLFVMMAGVGLDAAAVARVNDGFKKKFGKAAYIWAGLEAFARPQAAMLEVVADGVDYEAAWVIVAKGRHYAGGYIVARDADLCTAEFQVCLFKGQRRSDLVRYLAAIGRNRLHRLSDVTIVPAHHVAISASAPVAVQIDGENHGLTPVEISVTRKPLPIIVPPDFF